MPRASFLASSAMLLLTSGTALAQNAGAGLSFFGTPGIIEMPTAFAPPSGKLTTGVSFADGTMHSGMHFQISDRISTAFRFSAASRYDGAATTILDPAISFAADLQFQLMEETDTRPAVAIGLRDFLTGGAYQSEYIVASKSFGDQLAVSAGLGWGGLGTRSPLGQPFGARPAYDPAQVSGQLASDSWFRGDVAGFAGLSYQINDRWGVLAEYSSAAYPQGPEAPARNAADPMSFGITYRPADGVQFTLAALNGERIGLSGSFALNANNRPARSGNEIAPLPIKPRAAIDRPVLRSDAQLSQTLSAMMALDGLKLVGLSVAGDTARLRFENTRYRAQAQAAGRIARMMTQVLPANITTFVLEPQTSGLPLSAISLLRADLERLENSADAANDLFLRTSVAAAGEDAGLTAAPQDTNGFTWALGPYFALSTAGGDLTVDTGLSLKGRYQLSPGFVVLGEVRQSVVRNAGADPVADATPDIQNVRTDYSYYGDDGRPVLYRLAATRYGRLGPDLYSRLSFGYLEEMFGGVSTEVLWKPADSRLGLGASLAYVAQRDTDMGFGFDEYDFATATGHLSAYYDLGNGYRTQVHLGRYLAGDWGATLQLSREFENGIRVAAYVSQTDMSYQSFGSGAYNKGVMVTVPQDFLTGTPSRADFGTRFHSRDGDGGARLNIDGRLYDVIRDGHIGDLQDTWGRFWR